MCRNAVSWHCALTAPALPPVDLISFEVHPTWFGFYVDMGETILKEGYRISTVYVTCDISFPDTSDSPDASCTVGKTTPIVLMAPAPRRPGSSRADRGLVGICGRVRCRSGRG